MTKMQLVPPDNPKRDLDASEGDLSRARQRAWKAIAAANQPPRLFVSKGKPIRLETTPDGTVVARKLTADVLRHELAKVTIYRKRFKIVHPPMAIVRDMLATPDPPLPRLDRIVDNPHFYSTPEAPHILEPGYNEDSKAYYAPRPGASNDPTRPM